MQTFGHKLSVLMLLVLIMCASCKSSKFLNGEESLLKEVKITIKDPQNYVKDEDAMKTEMVYFVRQHKNKKFLLIPREYIYFVHAEPDDTTKIDSWMRKVGEQPSIYNELLTQESVKAMEQYLRFKKGYYNANVSSNSKRRGKATYVEYLVTPGQRHVINSLAYFSTDTRLLTEINSIKSNSLLKIGEGLDADKFELEKNRLVSYLQNHGYADFAKNYITIKGDSSSLKKAVDVFIEILPPDKKKIHDVYRVGEIRVFTDHYNKQDTTGLYFEELNGVKFYREQTTFVVKPEVILKSISFVSNQITRREDRLNTYNKLSNLNAYRFAEIAPTRNKFDTSYIDYDIQLTPQINKWALDRGIDIFYSSLTRATDTLRARQLIGIGASIELENRNLLGGSERMIMSGSVGTQIELTNRGNPFRAFNYGFNTNVQFPVFKDPFKFIKGLNSARILKDELYKGFERDASTTINFNTNSVSFRDQYSILSVNGSWGYRFTDKISKSFIIEQIGLSANRYVLSDSFIRDIITNPFILNSFTDNFFTGLVFRSINYNLNSSRNEKGIARSLYSTFEVSGLEVSILNGILDPKNQWKIGDFNFSKFVKFEVDGRLTKFFKGKRSLVGRINGGIIVPIVGSQNAPYIKQFYVGGPNSLRGWAPRELGPGAYTIPNLDGQDPYSQSDIKLEANLEYRFKIWWILEGAVFLDAGNIWALNGADTLGGNFSKDFTKQIAVASGWGMRWDFNYFNIRFDFGYKLREPFKTDNRNWYNWNKIKDQKFGNIQVAVNYPF